MRNVVVPVAVLGVFALAALLLWKVVLPAVEKDQGPRREAPEPPPPPGLPDETRAMIEKASDLQAPERIREALGRFAGQPAEREIRSLFTARRQAVERTVRTKLDALLDDYRYDDAAALLDSHRRAWLGTKAAPVFKEWLAELREEQADQVFSRKRESDQLVDLGRYDAAREALSTDWQFEEDHRLELARHAEIIERRIRVRSFGERKPLTPAPVAPAPVAKVAPSRPPPLPGYPHPDVRRLADAKALFARAKALFSDQRYGPAVQALEEFAESYGDLGFVERKSDAVAAMRLLALHGQKGLGGLFHATSSKMSGGRLRLRYEFKGTEEYLDWEEFKTIPHKDEGKFEPTRTGVRGTGVMAYLLRAYFRNDVQIRCLSRPTRIKTHGLAFCQQDLETRQILFLVTNHWFVEGENYVKERRGHSLLMIGKGTNNDVPVDSPEIGFIFEGPTYEKPQPPPGGELKISFELRGNRMTAEVGYKKDTTTLRGEAVGDDGRGIERVRPALFVVQNGVHFSEIVVEGRIHPDFERQRVRELLDRID
jgi:hypothetical protein